MERDLPSSSREKVLTLAVIPTVGASRCAGLRCGRWPLHVKGLHGILAPSNDDWIVEAIVVRDFDWERRNSKERVPQGLKPVLFLQMRCQG